MSVTLTLQGESLMARLQAEGKVLDIDTFLFAHVEGLDPTAPASPAAGIPANVVFRSSIPDEFKAYVTPNQVVYSALLGSDVGDFEFNWQGLYCSEHDTLVAYSTLPTLKKRAYNPATNTAGNNLNRNFILSYSGIQELTNITISPKTWQLDFTIRHKGIDERERLSNRDIYHRSGFFDDGWKLEKNGDVLSLKKGVGYIEGIRCELIQDEFVAPQALPCDVYLDVCMEQEGSDVVTKVTPLFFYGGNEPKDYLTPKPFNTQHYVEQVASIDENGIIKDLRRIIRLIPDVGEAGQFLALNAASQCEFKGIDFPEIAIASKANTGVVQIGTGIDVDAKGLISLLFGKVAGTACQGNDERLQYSQSLAETGWQKFPSGLIIQWGYTATSAPHNNVYLTFPIAFNKRFMILGMHTGTQPVVVIEHYGDMNLPNRAVLIPRNLQGGSLPGWVIHWIALGC